MEIYTFSHQWGHPLYALLYSAFYFHSSSKSSLRMLDTQGLILNVLHQLKPGELDVKGDLETQSIQWET